MPKRTRLHTEALRNLKFHTPAQDAAKGLENALANSLAARTKEELIQALLELARQDPKTSRRLTNHFGIVLPKESPIEETRRAIFDATAFDERETNSNFDYDSGAYETVARNLATLAKSGSLAQAMDLSLELMRRGSYQVEQSDEGLMTDEIEECLEPVLDAVRSSSLPAKAAAAWCREMMRADRVEFICREALEALAKLESDAGK